MGLKVSSKDNLPKLETIFSIEGYGSNVNIKLGALEFNHALSICEKYLYVQLCNSKSEDSGMFIKIDTATGGKIYSVIPEWGWASNYTFVDGEGLVVITHDYGSWRIDDRGNIVDRAGYYMHRVKVADHGVMRALPVFFELHGKTPETCAMAIESIDHFLETCSSMFHGLSYGALALKAKAEIMIFLGEDTIALQSCVDALNLDPKVSVKRMLNSLCKKLNLDKNSLRSTEWAEKLKISVEKFRANEFKQMEVNRGRVNIKQDVENSVVLEKSNKLAGGVKIKRYYFLLCAIFFAIMYIWFSR